METLAQLLALVAFGAGCWLQFRLNARKQHFMQIMPVYNQLLRAGQEAELPSARALFATGARFPSPSLQNPYEKWQDRVSAFNMEEQEEELVLESANPFYNAYVAAYFQQQKRMQMGLIGAIALFVVLMWFV
jgi:hypothetical protein